MKHFLYTFDYIQNAWQVFPTAVIITAIDEWEAYNKLRIIYNSAESYIDESTLSCTCIETITASYLEIL